MEWSKELPKSPGKYLVETKTMMGNTHRLESFFNGKTWNFTNQTFIKYLEENAK